MAYLAGFLIFCLGGVTLSESATAYTTIGGSCLNNAECTIPNASCQDGVCVCSTNFVPRADALGCLPVVTYYQGTCEESIQCKIRNIPEERMSCENGQCVCHSKFSFRDGSCLGRANLREKCMYDTDCTTFTTEDLSLVWCFNEKCACRKGYKEDQDRCVIGGNCESDQDCTGVSNSGLANSFCNNLTRDLWHCACKMGYVSSINDTKCLEEKSRLGDSCVDDNQCKAILGAAECKNNQCMCRKNAKEENGKCNGASGLVNISALLLLLFIPTRFII